MFSPFFCCFYLFNMVTVFSSFGVAPCSCAFIDSLRAKGGFPLPFWFVNNVIVSVVKYTKTPDAIASGGVVFIIGLIQYRWCFHFQWQF